MNIDELLIVSVFNVVLVATVWSIYVHRAIYHRTVTYNTAVEYLFQCFLWLLFDQPTVRDIDKHKNHHRYPDTEKDPHSPHYLGKITTFIVLPYKHFKRWITEIFIFPSIKHTQKNTPTQFDKNPIKFMYKYPSVGHIVFLGISLLTFGFVDGIIIFVCTLIGAVIYINVFGVGVVHMFGYANYKLKNKSKNIFPIGFLLGGEELHNNHHKFPNSVKFSKKRWEVDFGYIYIKALSHLKLCKIEGSKK